jgi:membrane-bound metal-dependent hydrolase YbcI (DUF457 family)
MTSKTHVALGLLTSLIIQKYNPHIETYTLVSGVCIGSLIPDLDTKKSDPSQIFPPISYIVDKFTKHRGFTHTILPFLLLTAYYALDSPVCLWMGIGGLTHLILDVFTKYIKVTCGSVGEKVFYLLFWLGSAVVIGNILWIENDLTKHLNTIINYEGRN